MPFEIVRNDITKMAVDAIVNTANPRPVIGSGADAAIHMAAGPGLLEARKAIGDIAVGTAVVTPAFDLDAKYVIHTVGPVWEDGAHGEREALASCYRSALAKALELNCESIAFPLLSTGNYGFPKDQALQIAIREFTEFLMEHEMMIYQVVFSRDAFQLSESLFRSVQSYIDDHYIEEQEEWQDALFEDRKQFNAYRRDEMVFGAVPDMAPSMAAPTMAETTMAAPEPEDLKERILDLDAGFSETLLKLIDESGEKDSTIYKRANVTKQTFNKIKNNPNYHPKLETAAAFAFALHLTLDETNEFLRHAGLAFSNTTKFDVIVQWALINKMYNVLEVNQVLFDYDQKLLGTVT